MKIGTATHLDGSNAEETITAGTCCLRKGCVIDYYPDYNNRLCDSTRRRLALSDRMVFVPTRENMIVTLGMGKTSKGVDILPMREQAWHLRKARGAT
jgi:hypothetical protein